MRSRPEVGSTQLAVSRVVYRCGIWTLVGEDVRVDGTILGIAGRRGVVHSGRLVMVDCPEDD